MASYNPTEPIAVCAAKRKLETGSADCLVQGAASYLAIYMHIVWEFLLICVARCELSIKVGKATSFVPGDKGGMKGHLHLLCAVMSFVVAFPAQLYLVCEFCIASYSSYSQEFIRVFYCHIVHQK